MAVWIVLLRAASLPVGAKFGFCFGGREGSAGFEVEVKASFWDGRGALERERGIGDGDLLRLDRSLSLYLLLSCRGSLLRFLCRRR